MTMVLLRAYVFSCNATGCTTESDPYTPPLSLRRYSQWARRAAIVDGWVFLPKAICYCPNHAHLAEGQRTLR